jgi:hypothetical protein
MYMYVYPICICFCTSTNSAYVFFVLFVCLIWRIIDTVYDKYNNIVSSSTCSTRARFATQHIKKNSLLVVDRRLKFPPVNFLRPTSLNGRYFVRRRDILTRAFTTPIPDCSHVNVYVYRYHFQKTTWHKCVRCFRSVWIYWDLNRNRVYVHITTCVVRILHILTKPACPVAPKPFLRSLLPWRKWAR